MKKPDQNELHKIEKEYLGKENDPVKYGMDLEIKISVCPDHHAHLPSTLLTVFLLRERTILITRRRVK